MNVAYNNGHSVIGFFGLNIARRKNVHVIDACCERATSGLEKEDTSNLNNEYSIGTMKQAKKACSWGTG